MDNYVEEFRSAISDAGLVPPEIIEADGRLRRFSSDGRHGGAAGWYVMYGDGVPAGAFGDWRTGVCSKWRANGNRRLSAQEQTAHRLRWQEVRREREADTARRQADARSSAMEIWNAATDAPADHPYLIRKGVNSHGIRVRDGALVVPMREGADLHSVQFIDVDGSKRFLTGGRVSGCYFAIGKPDGVICIAEGYATGATLLEATGYAVAVAFNAGNLHAVATAIRKKYPSLRIIMCADDDAGTDGNPGLSKAKSAAEAVGGHMAAPDFGPGRHADQTDFNDLARALGMDAVRASVANAIPLATEPTSALALHYVADLTPPSVDEPDDAPVDRITSGDQDFLTSQPQSKPAMFYGLLGDTARIASDGREISPVSAALAAMTWLSAHIGRNLIVPVGDKWHRLNLFGLHIGASAFAGKGESLALMQRIARVLDKAGAPLGTTFTGGLSTGEGLACLIHDGYTEGKKEYAPIPDKRLLIIEEEFGALLARMRRDGNTLSGALRGAWDGLSIAPAIKGTKVWASNPHCSMHACITPTELCQMLTKGDMSNGFANRFLMIFAERVAVVPNPWRTDPEVVEDLACQYRSVVEWALRGYPDRDEVQALPMTTDARALWDRTYRNWKEAAREDGLAHLTERRYPMALRIAGLFAATDRVERTELRHLEAAIAWINYCIDTVHYVFGQGRLRERDQVARDHALRLREYLLDAAGWRSRTTIANELFKKRIKADELTAALDWLLRSDSRLARRDVPTGTPKMRTEYRLLRDRPLGKRGERGNRDPVPLQLEPQGAEYGGLQAGDGVTAPGNPQESAGLEGDKDAAVSGYPCIPRSPQDGDVEGHL